MCGIFCSVSSPDCDCNQEDSIRAVKNSAAALLRHRGPDHCGDITMTVAERRLKMEVLSTVLWLRGRELVGQPYMKQEADKGHFLCWNGDVFGGLQDNEEESDTVSVFKGLASAADVPKFLSGIEGPFAFVYYRPETESLWFGRDYFGRHSLLVSRDDGDNFILTSVADPAAGVEFIEVPADGVYEARLDKFGEEGWIHVHKWHSDSQDRRLDGRFFVVDRDAHLKERLSFCNDPIEGDSWVESALNEKWPPERIMAEFESRHSDTVDGLEEVLLKSLRKRVTKQPNLCKDCVARKSDAGDCDHAKIGILFSGGIDSAVIAALADRIVPTGEQVDLINVAFAKTAQDSFEAAPDRLTALRALEELRAASPNRRWRMVFVDAEREELARERQRRIAKLLYPHDTVLDDSIGCALWFAARGMGNDGYKSPARVLLLGMGADEQLGGYSRHRGRFVSSGGDFAVVSEEIELEVGRISERNLGRDNRIVADSGVAPRFPYLDENVVRFLAGVPTRLKADLRLPRGLGEKLLLRCLAARSTVGLTRTALEPKRAIQFGSRIAKLEVAKERGGDRAVRL